MKNDNTFKQAARWAARMFGYKATTRAGRIIWHVFITSATILTLILAITYLKDSIDRRHYAIECQKKDRAMNEPTYLHEQNNRYLSSCVIFHNGIPGYLFNTAEGVRTLTGIRWICKSPYDSLACYACDEKRGYFNLNNGKEVISAQYDKAWVFSEGVACVMNGGEVTVINHQGNPVINKSFPYSTCIDSYCFHHGICPMLGDNHRIGLINRKGEWVVDPTYKYINYNENGFWIAWNEELKSGLLDSTGTVLLPFVFESLRFIDDGEGNSCIAVRTCDHLDQLYDLKGCLLNACSYYSVDVMEYATSVYDDYGDQRMTIASCYKYQTSDHHYGLMDKNGNPITFPLYTNIYALTNDLFFCENAAGGVLLNSKGKECNKEFLTGK